MEAGIFGASLARDNDPLISFWASTSPPGLMNVIPFGQAFPFSGGSFPLTRSVGGFHPHHDDTRPFTRPCSAKIPLPFINPHPLLLEMIFTFSCLPISAAADLLVSQFACRRARFGLSNLLPPPKGLGAMPFRRRGLTSAKQRQSFLLWPATDQAVPPLLSSMKVERLFRVQRFPFDPNPARGLRTFLRKLSLPDSPPPPIQRQLRFPGRPCLTRLRKALNRLRMCYILARTLFLPFFPFTFFNLDPDRRPRLFRFFPAFQFPPLLCAGLLSLSPHSLRFRRLMKNCWM